MDQLNWETFNQVMLDYQQELLGLGLLVALILVAGFALKVRKSSKRKAEIDSEPVASIETDDKNIVDETAPVLEEVPQVEAPIVEPVHEKTLSERFRSGLARTGQHFSQLFVAGSRIDDDFLEELETYLLMADVGVELTEQVLTQLKEQIKAEKLDSSQLKEALQKILLDIVLPCQQTMQLAEQAPTVILVVGVNGVGKTTTVGKLSRYFSLQDKKVLLAAGDTFRAAAVEQLQQWGQRNHVPVVAQHTGADSASVIYDAIESAKAKNIDIVIADTAGRLHNKSHLMEELNKVKRVAGKLDPAAPHEVILVLDAGTGQNALSQMEEFSRSAGVTGIVLTKLDGTAKGGVVFPLCQKFKVPVRFVGLGEGADDLQPFNAEAFVKAMFDGE